jgi:hypothetical protein
VTTAVGDVIGWKLEPSERLGQLDQFEPHWPDVVADHVTLMSGAGDMPLPTCTRGEVIGRADDGDGVEALVVSIDGSSARPGGGTYHITWSLDQAQGRRAVESNDVIAALGWTPIAPPISITLIPARF